MMQSRLLRVSRLMRKKYPNEKSMNKALKEAQEPDANGNISVDALKKFVLTECKDALVAQKLAKRDVESFLSAFIYNSYGSTNFDHVAPLVYTDENVVSTKLNHRVRGNPPPVEANGDIQIKDLQESDVHNSKVKSVLQEIENKIYDGPVRQFAVFKKFDKDNDGFVSYADFEEALGEMRVNAS
jgi:Ca2+-binding EF-hand superfamily protein